MALAIVFQAKLAITVITVGDVKEVLTVHVLGLCERGFSGREVLIWFLGMTTWCRNLFIVGG